MNRWQPIAIAPRDGTWVFAWCFEDFPRVVTWHSEIDYGDEGIDQIWKCVITDRFVIPTHWMPIKSPMENKCKNSDDSKDCDRINADLNEENTLLNQTLDNRNEIIEYQTGIINNVNMVLDHMRVRSDPCGFVEILEKALNP